MSYLLSRTSSCRSLSPTCPSEVATIAVTVLCWKHELGKICSLCEIQAFYVKLVLQDYILIVMCFVQILKLSRFQPSGLTLVHEDHLHGFASGRIECVSGCFNQVQLVVRRILFAPPYLAKPCNLRCPPIRVGLVDTIYLQ